MVVLKFRPSQLSLWLDWLEESPGSFKGISLAVIYGRYKRIWIEQLM